MKKHATKSKMSPDERARRRKAVGAAATEKIAKSEQLNFRIEERAIRDLQELAYSKRLPVGTMIREWVLERLAVEKHQQPDLAGQALFVLDEFYSKLNTFFGTSTDDDLGSKKRVGSKSALPKRTRSATKAPGAKAKAKHKKQ